ncbi:MAG: hypothetical protein QM805_01925 [Pseudomonas sp.]
MRNQSFLLDLWILLKTTAVVLGRRERLVTEPALMVWLGSRVAVAARLAAMTPSPPSKPTTSAAASPRS